MEQITCDIKLEREKLGRVCRYGLCDGSGYIERDYHEGYDYSGHSIFAGEVSKCECIKVERDLEDENRHD